MNTNQLSHSLARQWEPPTLGACLVQTFAQHALPSLSASTAHVHHFPKTYVESLSEGPLLHVSPLIILLVSLEQSLSGLLCQETRTP